MSKAIAEIVNRISESAEVFGLMEAEIISLVVVAKFQTEFSNAVLSNTLHTLFLRTARDETLVDITDLGMDIQGGTVYDVLDIVSDFLKTATQEQRNKLSETFGGESVLQLIQACFGEEHKF